MSGLFDIINNISESSKRIDFHKKDYVPFVVNKGFSYYVDSILYVNEMNVRPGIPYDQHYEYLHASLRKKKRRSKWHKKEAVNDVELVMSYYKYSQNKAEEVLKILTPEQLSEIRSIQYTGGK